MEIPPVERVPNLVLAVEGLLGDDDSDGRTSSSTTTCFPTLETLDKISASMLHPQEAYSEVMIGFLLALQLCTCTCLLSENSVPYSIHLSMRFFDLL